MCQYILWQGETEPAVLWTDLRTHIVYGGDEEEDGRDDVEEDDEG